MYATALFRAFSTAIACFLVIPGLAVLEESGQDPQGQLFAGSSADICDTQISESSDLSHLVPDGLPPGVRFDVLVDKVVEQWPADLKYYLYVTRVDFEPDAEFGTRHTDGVILLYRSTDNLGVRVGGDPTDSQSTATLVHNLHYYVQNNGAEPATVWVVEVTPEFNPNVISRDRPLPGPDPEPSPQPGTTENLLLSAELMTVPTGPYRLVIGCLSWTESGIELGQIHFGGVIGIRVVQGLLKVEDMSPEELGPGLCLPFAPGSVHQISGGDDPPIVLVVGVLPEGVPLWEHTAEPLSTHWNPDEYDCQKPVDEE